MNEGQKVIVALNNDQHITRLIKEEITDMCESKVRTVCFNKTADAFEYIISNDVHTVISEIILSDLSGAKLLSACKAIYPGLPFIVYSAYGGLFESEDLADFHLIPSPDLRELLEAVRKCISMNFNTGSVDLFNLSEGTYDQLSGIGTVFVKIVMEKTRRKTC